VTGAQPTAQREPLRYQTINGVALEQGAAEVEVDASAVQNVDLPLDVLGHQAGAPAELHEVHEFPDAAHGVLELTGEHPGIDHHREPTLSRLGIAVR
jgi:hypothetical protein